MITIRDRFVKDGKEYSLLYSENLISWYIFSFEKDFTGRTIMTPVSLHEACKFFKIPEDQEILLVLKYGR